MQEDISVAFLGSCQQIQGADRLIDLTIPLLFNLCSSVAEAGERSRSALLPRKKGEFCATGS